MIVLCLDQDEAEIVTCKVNEFHKNKNFTEKHFNQNQALKESKRMSKHPQIMMFYIQFLY